MYVNYLKPLTLLILKLNFLVLKVGVVSQAKGSAYIEVGKTKVIVSVFDPREIPNKSDFSLKGELYCEFKYAPFSCPVRRSHQLDDEEKQNSIIMKQSLESAVCRQEFPNFQVDIYALVLQNDGSALSAAITCSGLALAHAGVPMFDVITSVSLGFQGNTFLLDPTLDEEQTCEVANIKDTHNYDSHGIVTLSIMSTHQQISQFYQTGNMNLEDLDKALKLLTEANMDIVPLVEKALVKYVLKRVKKDSED